MMAAVTAANAVGLRATARMQLGLAAVLAALLLVAVVTALPESRADHWTPFAPHGWAAVGTAASLLMLSFIGWEAVSHLAGELRDPARQLPRAILAALAVVVVLYLGLAVATVGVLGTSAPSDVPLADLMAAGLGEPGRTVTAALAVLLTMGTMNAYVAAAVKLAGALAGEGSAPALLARPGRALALFAGIARAAARAARRRAARRRRSRARDAAPRSWRSTSRRRRPACGCSPARRGSRPRVAFAAVVVVLAFSGPFLVVPAAVAAAVRLPYLWSAITPASRSHGDLELLLAEVAEREPHLVGPHRPRDRTACRARSDARLDRGGAQLDGVEAVGSRSQVKKPPVGSLHAQPAGMCALARPLDSARQCAAYSSRAARHAGARSGPRGRTPRPSRWPSAPEHWSVVCLAAASSAITSAGPDRPAEPHAGANSFENVPACRTTSGASDHSDGSGAPSNEISR